MRTHRNPANCREHSATYPASTPRRANHVAPPASEGRIPPGTGVKTKVLEAMAAGLPVVTTPDGIDGIGVRHGDSCLVGGSDDELAGAVIRVRDDAALAARLGAAGRAVVSERFAQEVVTARWRDALAEATGDRQAPG